MLGIAFEARRDAGRVQGRRARTSARAGVETCGRSTRDFRSTSLMPESVPSIGLLLDHDDEWRESRRTSRWEQREATPMPRRDDIQKILLIGSGPIVIGQAAEFDYSGVQACKVLLEEGYEVVLVNSNPATIMTDPEFADRTYVEPLLPELGGADHRARAPRRAAADARRPDGAQPGQGAARRRHAGALRRRADRRRLRRDPPRRGPRGLPRDDGGRRPAGARGR